MYKSKYRMWCRSRDSGDKDEDDKLGGDGGVRKWINNKINIRHGKKEAEVAEDAEEETNNKM